MNPLPSGGGFLLEFRPNKSLSAMSSQSADPKTQSEVNAIVVGEIASDKLWHVRFNGAIWHARLSQKSSKNSFLPGEAVCVVGRDEITLLIQPLSDSPKFDSSTSTTVEKGAFLGDSSLPIYKESLQRNFKDAQSSSSRFEKVSEKGDRMIAFASGGAFLGGLIAQIPGAVAGALAGAIFGWFDEKSANSPENS
jgi:hypothetical protein